MKHQKMDDAMRDDKVAITDIFAIFREMETFQLSCRDAIDNSAPVDICKQNTFNAKCKKACSLAPYELRRALLLANKVTSNVKPTSNNSISPPKAKATEQHTPNKSLIMKQYITDRDYELDFQHRSMLRATVTQLGITSGQCEDTCLSDNACAIATYSQDNKQCVYKTTLATGDVFNTKVNERSGDVYPNFKPKVVSFEKVPGKAAEEASRRELEVIRLLKDAEDKKSKLIFDENWLHKPNTSISNVLYSWSTDIRSEKDPTDVHIMTCAEQCKGTPECSAFVIRRDTSDPKNGDAVCGLVLQQYHSDSVVSTMNISMYERRNRGV